MPIDLLLWQLALDVCSWFSVENQKSVRWQIFFFHFSDPSENEVFWLSRIKNSRIKKSDATSEDQLFMISNFGFWSKISFIIKVIQESLFLLAPKLPISDFRAPLAPPRVGEGARVG